MRKLYILLSAAIIPVQAHAVPSISAPENTQGVVLRDAPALIMVERPLPKPDTLRTEEEKKQIDGKKIAMALKEWQAMFPAMSKDYQLIYEIDPQLVGDVGRDEYVSPEYVLGQHDTTGLVKRVRMDSPTLLASSAPVDAMTSYVMNTLSSKYDMNYLDGEAGYDRLLQLASGEQAPQQAALISSDSYDFPDVETEAEQPANMSLLAPPSTLSPNVNIDPAAAIINSLSREQVSMMTPEQITALVAAAHGNVPQITQPVIANQSANVLAGIPSLDYRGEDLPAPTVISASDVPSGSSPFSEQTAPAPNSAVMTGAQMPQMIMAQAPAPVMVGNGENLLLKGWKLGLTGSGQIGMYLEGDPSSIIEINEGMVIGPLGNVESLTMENGEIIARFSTGEVMTSPAALVSLASL